jgi:LysM repeat protein
VITSKNGHFGVFENRESGLLTVILAGCSASHVPTTPMPGGVVINSTAPTLCASGKTSSAKAGDTCDSIAQANKISSATLYYINSGLQSCDNISAGSTVCLPQTCETTYSVKSTDTCVAIGVDQGTPWQNIVAWNAGLDSQCSNIVGAKPSWGSTICVTPPGGGFEGSEGNATTPGNGNIGGQGGSGDGYADQRVDPPAGGTVAQGTTKKCGQYYQAKPGDDCAKTLARETVSMDLFIQINPSLVSAASCTSKLLASIYYCLRPLRYWNEA